MNCFISGIELWGIHLHDEGMDHVISREVHKALLAITLSVVALFLHNVTALTRFGSVSSQLTNPLWASHTCLTGHLPSVACNRQT